MWQINSGRKEEGKEEIEEGRERRRSVGEREREDGEGEKKKEKERKVLGKSLQWGEVTHCASLLINQGRVWDVLKELPADAVLIHGDDVCIAPHSLPGKLCNNI